VINSDMVDFLAQSDARYFWRTCFRNRQEHMREPERIAGIVVEGLTADALGEAGRGWARQWSELRH
jgi:hypothetical protein